MNYSVHMRRNDFGKNLKAFADVTFCFTECEITLRNFKVIQKEGENPWVALPANTYKDKSGQFKNDPMVEIPSKIKEEIIIKILEQYNNGQA